MGILKHRRSVLAPNVTELETNVDQLHTDVTVLETDVSNLEAVAQEYIAIKHSVADDDLTVTSSNATYKWTGVNFQSTPANFTLVSDVLLFNIGGKFSIDYTCLFAGSGGTVFPFWAWVFIEIDEGTIGSWSSVTGSHTGTSIEFDPGGGQTKISNSCRVITSVAAGDSLRVRVRRGSGAATTVKSDGAGGGSNWNITKIAD